MKKTEAIAWLEVMKEDAIFEQNDALKMAIDALQGDMYCPNCGVRLVQEDEYVEPTHTHGRLIDADALIEDLQHDIQNDENMLDDQATEDKEQIQFDKDCKQNAVDLLENAPTASVIDITQRDLCEDINCEDCPFLKGTCKLMDCVAYADRPHGEWILECDSEGDGDNLYRCSKCGCEYGCQEYDKPNFCLECGADMRQKK